MMLARSLALVLFLRSVNAFLFAHHSSGQSAVTCAMSSSAASFTEAVSEAASKALGKKVELVPASGGGYSGGGGATTSALLDKETNTKYFLKSSRNGLSMLRAEYEGVKAMSETGAIQVPTPIAFGEFEKTGQGFALFEYLEFCGAPGASQYELGVNLAKMHRSTSANGFGFHIDNTIGATPQPNSWEAKWPDFWDKHRLGHMLKLTGNAGLSLDKVEKLRQKTRELLSHNPAPSLIHGDLWGGNKGFCKRDGKVVPVIFDPATYYGDREADVAMTYVFGGFSSDFYDGYESEWPLPEGHERRRTVYNLYHILNQYVCCGETVDIGNQLTLLTRCPPSLLLMHQARFYLVVAISGRPTE
jgi:fructosamine-3-kinase